MNGLAHRLAMEEIRMHYEMRKRMSSMNFHSLKLLFTPVDAITL